MAGLHSESFDRLSIATLTTKYSAYVGGGGHAIDAAYGRAGRGLLLTSYIGNFFSFQKLLGVTRSVLYIGVALNPRDAAAKVVGGWYSNTDLRCMFGFNSSLQPILAQAGGVIVAAGNKAAHTNAWCYLGIKCTFGAPGAGRVDFRLNREDAGSVTGLNLGPDANNLLIGRGNAWIWGGFDTGDVWMDDLIVYDDQAPTPSDWIGDHRVFSCRVNGAGSLTQMAPTGAATNHGCTGDDIHDGDATYVATSTPGDTDLYAKEALANAKNIKWVQLNGVFRSDDATSRTARLVLKSGAATAESADVGFANSYIGKSHIEHTDPNTGAAFTPANFNAAEIGQKLTS